MKRGVIVSVMCALFLTFGCAPTATWVSRPLVQTGENANFKTEIEPLKMEYTFYVAFKLVVTNKTDRSFVRPLRSAAGLIRGDGGADSHCRLLAVELGLLYKTKGPVPEEPYTIPLGKADVKREGSDLTIEATSIMVQRSLEAATQLAQEGIDVEVVDPRTLRPLDAETIVQSV